MFFDGLLYKADIMAQRCSFMSSVCTKRVRNELQFFQLFLLCPRCLPIWPNWDYYVGCFSAALTCFIYCAQFFLRGRRLSRKINLKKQKQGNRQIICWFVLHIMQCFSVALFGLLVNVQVNTEVWSQDFLQLCGVQFKVRAVEWTIVNFSEHANF